MKRLFALLTAIAMLLSAAGCQTAVGSDAGVSAADSSGSSSSLPEAASAAGGESAAASSSSAAAQEGSGGILVAYFSWADNAVLDEEVDAVASPSVLSPGNVEQLAGWVQEETGGDLFSIQVADPYPSDWDVCLERANSERGEDARPELVAAVENLDGYDTVFLGYPNWWYGVPMALLTFLEQNDLSGKEVYLFCSHGTGGLAQSVEIIAEAAPGAILSDNIFDCYEEEAPSSQEAIQAWVRELGFGGEAEAAQEATQPAQAARQIQVQWGEETVLYELNDSAAAAALYSQLPLTVEIEDYSTNEKIFYPTQQLDTTGAPLAEGGAGTLAYYAPWGDVVLFYDSYSANPSLYELGQVVSGGELVGELSGTVVIQPVE